jgi:Ca2+:H+ antiporter
VPVSVDPVPATRLEGMFGLSTRRVAALAATAALTAAAGTLAETGANGTATFITSAVALAGLAWIVSLATEAIGEHFGPGLTGVLQSTLGNLPELFVVLFALGAGQTTVAQTSILGSLFANALLVLGGVLIVGAVRAPGGVMRFSPRLPNDTTTLLLLAVFVISLLGVASAAHDPAAKHAVAISIVGAVALLITYAAWIIQYLKDDAAKARAETVARVEPNVSHTGLVSLPIAIGLLVAAGTAAAFVSDWFVSSIDPAVQSLGISKAFAGLVIVGIAGNAVENVAGLVLAHKGQSDIAISVVKNSVSQIAAFLYPVLILASLLFAHRLTFQIAPVYIAALVLTALSMWQISGDGEARIYEGVALIGLYVILAILTFYE